MRRALEGVHLCVFARNVEHRLVSRLLQNKGALGVGDDLAVERHAHTLGGWLDRDRMGGSGNFHCGLRCVSVSARMLRSISAMLLIPQSAMVTSSSVPRISIARATPACPPAPRP